MSKTDEALTFEADLNQPPETVRRALTEPALVDAWLPADPAISRELVENRPDLVRYAWRDERGDPPLQSEVRFVLPPTPGGTHLTVIHGGLTRPAADPAATFNLKMAA